MAKAPSAGDLIHKVAFEQRSEVSADLPADYGNEESDWIEKFVCRADYVHLRGGESVLSARLSSQHVQVIRVRSSAATRGVTTSWRIRDTRTEQTFNIRDIEPSRDRGWLEFLCDTGGAEG